jgi:hypothetical protein
MDILVIEKSLIPKLSNYLLIIPQMSYKKHPFFFFLIPWYVTFLFLFLIMTKFCFALLYVFTCLQILHVYLTLLLGVY